MRRLSARRRLLKDLVPRLVGFILPSVVAAGVRRPEGRSEPPLHL